MKRPPAAAGPLPCLFCERAIKPFEPVLATNFTIPNDTRIGHAPAHVACLIQTIAGETSRAVLSSLATRDVDVGLERGDEGLDDLLGSIVARLVEKHL